MKKETKKATSRAKAPSKTNTKAPTKAPSEKAPVKIELDQPQGRLLTAEGWKKLMLPGAKKTTK